MELIKKSLLLITLVTVMGIAKTEQSNVEKLAAKDLEIIERQEKEQKEWQAKQQKEQIENAAREALLKQQQEEKAKRKVQKQIRRIENAGYKAQLDAAKALCELNETKQKIANLNQKIDLYQQRSAEVIAGVAGITFFTLVCFLNHIGFKINFAAVHTV